MGRVEVRCLERQQYGDKIYGPSGVIYMITSTGQFHALLANDALDPVPGVLYEQDAAEFSKIPQFRVEGYGKTPPAVGAPPAEPKSEAPKGPPPMPADDADDKAWLAWAKAVGLPLSREQKKLAGDELKFLIQTLYAEEQEEIAGETPSGSGASGEGSTGE